jgi:hypothetical protein
MDLEAFLRPDQREALGTLRDLPGHLLSGREDLKRGREGLGVILSRVLISGAR